MPIPKNYIQRVKLSYINKTPKEKRVSIFSADAAAEVFRKTWDNGHLDMIEEFKAMYLNNAMEVLAVMDVSKGTIDHTPVEIRHVFAGGILLNASKMILAHNHPSGNLTPSKNDMLITGEFIKASHFMNIDVHDHIIMGREGHFSFAENGVVIKRPLIKTRNDMK